MPRKFTAQMEEQFIITMKAWIEDRADDAATFDCFMGLYRQAQERSKAPCSSRLGSNV